MSTRNKANGRAGKAAAKPKRAAKGAAGRAAPDKRQRARAEPSDLDGVIESDSDDEDDPRFRARARGENGLAAAGAASDESEEEAEEEDVETADERRVRMAKAMLAKLEAAKRATSRGEDSDADSDAVENDIDRELAKQAAQAAGRHFERIAARLHGTSAAAAPVQILEGHKRAPTALALSSDERTVYSGSKGGELLKWDVETGQLVRLTPEGVKCAPIASLALSADGHLLATGGPDKLLHIWDTRIGKCTESFKVSRPHTVPTRCSAQRRYARSSKQAACSQRI